MNDRDFVYESSLSDKRVFFRVNPRIVDWMKEYPVEKFFSDEHRKYLEEGNRFEKNLLEEGFGFNGSVRVCRECGCLLFCFKVALSEVEEKDCSRCGHMKEIRGCKLCKPVQKEIREKEEKEKNDAILSFHIFKDYLNFILSKQVDTLIQS